MWPSRYQANKDYVRRHGAKHSVTKRNNVSRHLPGRALERGRYAGRTANQSMQRPWGKSQTRTVASIAAEISLGVEGSNSSHYRGPYQQHNRLYKVLWALLYPILLTHHRPSELKAASVTRLV